MKRKAVALTVVGVAAIVAGMVFVSQRDAVDKPASTAPSQVDSRADAEASGTKAEEAQAVAAGKYVDYTPDVIANTPGDKILFFHASWCPQCRALEKSIEAGGIPGGTTIIKVDYDANQQLRQKYGVTIQTTMVKVNDNGDLVKRYVAYDEPTLQALVRNFR